MIKLTLTKDHLKLIPFILIKNDNDKSLEIDKEVMLQIQTHLLDDVSLILGMRNLAIPKTDKLADGREFPDDVETYMRDTYNYVRENLFYIETLIHQYVVNGGLTEGTYTCKEDEYLWKKISD